MDATAEAPTRNGIERRWSGYVIGTLLAITGFLVSTSITFGLFWLNALSSRVGTLEARGQAVETRLISFDRVIDEIRSDLKEIKADLKRISK